MNHWNRDLDRLQRSGIRRFTNMAKEVPGCVMLTIGEPDFDTPEPICQAAAQARCTPPLPAFWSRGTR